MRVVVTGARGMLGSEVTEVFKKETVFPLSRDDLDITDYAAIQTTMDKINPDLVINCAGIVKARSFEVPYETVAANASGPHMLAAAGVSQGYRLIHISTDCVFSGMTTRPLHEITTPDAYDLYGRSKLLGEVVGHNCLTLRTSFIGFQGGLLHWLFEQEGEIDGWVFAKWTGVSVYELARIIFQLAEHPEIQGLLHIPAHMISKWQLLEKLNNEFALGLIVRRRDEPVINRELVSDRWDEFELGPMMTWKAMTRELAEKLKEFSGG